MIYLTYNDQPSGIFTSQVTDVVNYLNAIGSKKVRLVALISVRQFRGNKTKIKSVCPGAIVLPMFPKASSWKLNLYTLYILCLFLKPDRIMARGVFATQLALKLRELKRTSKVIFDARGAYAAELNEYNVVSSPKLKQQISSLEKDALLRSDAQLAVSNALVEYWKKEYHFSGQNHVVIPCTLSRYFEFEFPTLEHIAELRTALLFDPSDIIYIYSGSSAGWQSFELVDDHLYRLMSSNASIKLIILAHNFDEKYKIYQHFRERLLVKHVTQQEVKNYLLAADHGILFREQSVTNLVASPVKYAEYLSCGLKVMISDNLGDYSSFSKEHNLLSGAVERTTYEEKKRIHELAMRFFLKIDYKQHYLRLLEH
ncbi:MAG: hypothetical protein JST26_15170 [Bacteroidetes bacterium]|nr:hypothetical protein [Bacteroidota bacterium]